MKNYMEEVAKLLGVKFGEEFEVGVCHVKYVLTEGGLFSVNTRKEAPSMLMYILNGTAVVHHKPWRPSEDETFYVVTYNGDIFEKYWDSESTVYLGYYKLGNCYKTKAEAEANRNKWIAFYASDKVLGEHLWK